MSGQFGNSSIPQQEQQQPPPWLPYQATKDCSLRICSIYCPQWCVFFPPPPPLDFSDVDDSPSSGGGRTFSPLVIAIIGVLAGAFLLVTYYTIISRYCGRFDFLRSPSSRNRSTDSGDGDPDFAGHDWHAPPGNGLDESLINKIAAYRYRRGEGLVDGTDCSVCLSEFREDESLRLLPKCSHAFHVRCIDTWLRSHSSCPLCRASVVFPTSSVSPPTPPPPPQQQQQNNNPTPAPPPENQPRYETVIIIEEDPLTRNLGVVEECCLCEEEEGDSNIDGEDQEDDEERRTEIVDSQGIERSRDQELRRSSSAGSAEDGSRLSIADVLRTNMEDEIASAAVTGAGTSGHGKTMQAAGVANPDTEVAGIGARGRGGVHGVISPVPMKQSFSSGRFFYSKQQQQQQQQQQQHSRERTTSSLPSS